MPSVPGLVWFQAGEGAVHVNKAAANIVQF